MPKLKVYEEYVIWKKELKEISKSAFEKACAHLKATDQAKLDRLSMKSIGDINI